LKSMKIGGLQKVSLIDYPGKICATVFCQGCNFHCPYCHNRELVDPGFYNACLAEEQMFDYLEKRRERLEAVTITGGEPTIQRDLIKFASIIRDMGYLVKIDTNGSQPEVLEQLLRKKLVDYIAMDIKAPLNKYDDATRTPGSDKMIRQSTAMVMSSGIDYEFRTTVVKSQINKADLLAIGGLIKDASLYALQRYVPNKPLDKYFSHETTFSQEEFAAIGKILAKSIKKIVIR
jgi:pyruvate formate lyase activating enzyme